VLLESHFVSEDSLVPTGEAGGDSWPLEDTTWTVLYPAAGGDLGPERPPAGEDSFVLGTHRQIVDPTLDESGQGTYLGQEAFWQDGPDALVYRTAPSLSTQVVAGPIAATIVARITSVDAEWYVSIQDEAPGGERSLLTRGYLRASHRALDATRTSWDGDVLYRPFHPHTNPEPVSPASVEQYQMEIVPAGFVIRPGHRLRFVITATPLLETYGVYQPSAPGIATVLRGGDAATSLLLPLVPLPDQLGPEPACGTQTAVYCA
jgi:predicted acyl esterase